MSEISKAIESESAAAGRCAAACRAWQAALARRRQPRARRAAPRVALPWRGAPGRLARNRRDAPAAAGARGPAGAAGRCAGGRGGTRAAAGARRAVPRRRRAGGGRARRLRLGGGLATRAAAGGRRRAGRRRRGGVGAGGLRRNASRRMRLVVVGVTNFAAPLVSRNLASAMIIAMPSRSLSGERAGRNAAERPSPMIWKT